MGAVALAVAIAVVVTLTFNVAAGVLAARIYRYGRAAAANTALMLVSRGEFELILALLAARLPWWLFAPRVEVRHAASGMGITTHSGA